MAYPLGIFGEMVQMLERPTGVSCGTHSQTLKLEWAMGATSVTRAPYGVADKAIGATSRSEVRYPLRTQPLVDDFRKPERPRRSKVINPRAI
ncbi:hypothetical protein F2Q69_00027444 [Brassica cretica]|uniref:Uncharacterized protein n=1 Tax=Brassica cretica TaxID=69181 RepID=A0A8S9SAL6_BRACR|nr:hypothetical protein F2Q69_00027444 [Brassica cretica]